MLVPRQTQLLHNLPSLCGLDRDVVARRGGYSPIPSIDLNFLLNLLILTPLAFILLLCPLLLGLLILLFLLLLFNYHLLFRVLEFISLVLIPEDTVQ